MRRRLQDLYRFLPVQLFLLHFRKSQQLLIFWLVLTLTVTGHFAANFGAKTLFLAPEYFGRISFAGMVILGAAMAVFVMSWHITTFIIHSKRMPFIGATRQAFLKYCFNNSLLPLLFLVFYSIVSVRYQWFEEKKSVLFIFLLQLGFYLGFLLSILLSFAYFFRVGRDLLKTVIARIANPSPVRGIIPYDTLDYEFDMVRADTFLSETLRVEHIKELEQYHPRLLNTVLRRHHRNAVVATFFSLLLLLTLGIFGENPLFRIPAGASFLILFSVMTAIVGAANYFLKSWEALGWVLFVLVFSWLVRHQLFDIRSKAFGLNYATATRPAYNYDYLLKLSAPGNIEQDRQRGLATLNNWKMRQREDKPPLVVLNISGGGQRAAYWTFHTLQTLDSLSNGSLFRHTVLITGASGGMIGGTYWRALNDLKLQGRIHQLYAAQYRENMGKDLLNAIMFSFASIDMVSPLNKISIGGYSYAKDRGYALEQELISNTGSVLDTRIGDYKAREAGGILPTLVYNGTVINDGRKLLVSAQPVSYLTRPVYSLPDSTYPPLDGVEFSRLFAAQDALNLRTTTALRMSATFPLVLPVVKLPANPEVNIMDAGLRDNFGVETSLRYLRVFADWIAANAGEVIILEIRDTREHAVFPSSEQDNLPAMLTDPIFAIEKKWEPFQSYNQSYMKDMAAAWFPGRFHIITMQYQPQQDKKAAALNFHLTQDEKDDIRAAIYNTENTASTQALLRLLQ